LSLYDALTGRIHPARDLGASTVQTRRDGGFLGPEQLRGLAVAEAHDVDGDQGVAEALRQRGNVLEDLACLEGSTGSSSSGIGVDCGRRIAARWRLTKVLRSTRSR
jgi:hypothetical protein